VDRPRVNLDARLPAHLAARVVGVSRQLFNYWRSSGKIEPDARGMYRYGDVVVLEAAMRRDPRSSRRPVGRPAADWATLDRKPNQSALQVA
jgi:hypothetical protein